MNGSRTINARKNIFSGYINKIVVLMLPFIARTVIIYILGAEYLGLSSLFTSILQMLNMAELGFSSAIVFSLYKPLAEHDDSLVCALMTYYRRVYQIIGIIILIVGLILLPFLKFLINGEPPSQVNIYLIFLVYLVNTCSSYLFFAYKNSLLQANQKMNISNNIHTIVHCSQYLLQIVLLLVFKNYYIYIIFLPIGTICNNIFVAYYANRLYPQYKNRRELDKKYKTELKKQIGGLAITKLCAVMRDSLDSITLSMFIGLTSVVIYGNYFYVINSIHGLLMVITSGIRAGVGNSLATETKEKNTSDMFKFNFLYALIYSWCFSCIVCLIQDFMGIWVGKELTLSTSSMLLFAIYFYSLCMSDIRNIYIEAKGLWWEYRIRAIIETIANLLLNIVFCYFWGITGVMLATLLTYWGVNVFYGTIILFKKYFGGSALRKYYKQTGIQGGIMFLVTAVMILLSQLMVVSNWIFFVGKVFLVAVCGGILYLLIYCSNSKARKLLIRKKP